jgi:hypothetical protein
MPPNPPKPRRRRIPVSSTIIKELSKGLRPDDQINQRRGQPLYRTSTRTPVDHNRHLTATVKFFADFQAVIDAWPDLPESIKAKIVEKIKAVK